MLIGFPDICLLKCVVKTAKKAARSDALPPINFLIPWRFIFSSLEYVFDVLLNENLILSIHALLCSLLIYLHNFWSIVNFVSRLLHGFNWIARQSAIQNYAVTIKNRSRLWSSWCSTVHFDKWQWSFVKNCSFDEKVQRMDHTPKPSALIFH